MKLVVLGLSLSSAWGNGHAVTFRALLSAFADRGHEVVFLERETPWYAAHRDVSDPPYCRLDFYSDLQDLERFADEVRSADAVLVGSYVPQGIEVGLVKKVLEGRPHIVDAMKNGEVHLVFNTTSGKQSLQDSFSLRRTALMMKIPYYTTTAGALAAAQAIGAIKAGDLDVRPIQDYA